MGRDWPAWGISFLVNCAVLLVLHSIVKEMPHRPQVTTLTSLMDERSEEVLVFESDAVAEIGNDGMTDSLSPTLARAMTRSDAQDVQEMRDKIEEELLPAPSILQEAIVQPPQSQLAVSFESRGASDVQPGGVKGAMDRITFEIATSLKERQTLALWLFDASTSLKERREAVAGRFENVYKQLSNNGTIEGLYTNAASFGQGYQLLADSPVTGVDELAAQVRTIPEDKSGVENVFTAVRQLVDQYKLFRRRDGRWNKLIFIITDEKGDDADQLESLITDAKRYGFRVFVIGNEAVFGQEKGYVRWAWEQEGYKFVDYLPVDQGPETAFPQLLDLAFWGVEDARVERMSAGYGPYALTRLCAETGGLYLITEQQSGYTFDPAIMRSYTPDYRPVAVIARELQQNEATRMLVQAAVESRVHEAPLPQTRFRAEDDTALRRAIDAAQKPQAALDFELKALYDLLAQGAKGRDKLTDPRWRASFDLAAGRVMAMRVRSYGYNVMLANMKTTPKTFSNGKNNEWVLVPSDEIDTGPSVRKLADEAKTYLQRVIEEHPGTPWAVLAERELSRPLGWSWKEGYNDIIAQMVAQGVDEPRLLLANEERQREERKQIIKRPPKL